MLSTQQFMYDNHLDLQDFSLINPMYFDYQQQIFPQIPEFHKSKVPENDERISKFEEFEQTPEIKGTLDSLSLPKFVDEKDRYLCAFSLN